MHHEINIATVVITSPWEKRWGKAISHCTQGRLGRCSLPPRDFSSGSTLLRNSRSENPPISKLQWHIPWWICGEKHLDYESTWPPGAKSSPGKSVVAGWPKDPNPSFSVRLQITVLGVLSCPCCRSWIKLKTPEALKGSSTLPAAQRTHLPDLKGKNATALNKQYSCAVTGLHQSSCNTQQKCLNFDSKGMALDLRIKYQGS